MPASIRRNLLLKGPTFLLSSTYFPSNVSAMFSEDVTFFVYLGYMSLAWGLIFAAALLVARSAA